MKKQDKNKLPTSVTHTKIDGLFLINRPVFNDNRGFFHEIYRKSELSELGIKFNPVQANHSRSLPRVIRALHTESWQKLVYPVNGKIFIAIADVRPKSSTFGKVETFEFENDNSKSSHTALFLPVGIGNSICVSGKNPVDYIYLVDKYWTEGSASGIAWDDPDLNIKWPVKNPKISNRDKNNPTLRELYPKKF